MANSRNQDTNTELFREFKKEFSDCYLGDNYSVLRFCLLDYLPIGILSTGIVGIGLFNELESMKLISSTDVKLLWEIAELTNMKNAKECIFRYTNKNDKNVNIADGTTLEPLRKKLYRALLHVTEEDLQTVVSFYELGTRFRRNQFETVWDVVYCLKICEELDISKHETVLSFAKLLNESAQTILLSTGTDDEIPKPSTRKQFREGSENKLQRLSKDELLEIKHHLINQELHLERPKQKFLKKNLGNLTKTSFFAIASMFTDLTLLKLNDTTCKKPTTLNEILEIIKSKRESKVIIEGVGGIGKSTLMNYLAYKWAESDDDTFEGKVLFLLNFRDIKPGENILKAIVKKIDIDVFSVKTGLGKDYKLIEQYLIRCSEDIVLLLDGLDELAVEVKNSTAENSLKLFDDQCFLGSTIIITSRPFYNLDELISKSTMHLKVDGFNENNICDYIIKYFNYHQEPEAGNLLVSKLDLNNPRRGYGINSIREYFSRYVKYYQKPEAGNSLVNELDMNHQKKEHSEIRSICKNPLLLQTVCNMWKDSKKLSDDNICDLFKTVFGFVINQSIGKQQEEKIVQLEGGNEYVHALVILGECLYNNLKSNKETFRKGDLKGSEEMVSLAIDLGLMCEDTAEGTDDSDKIYTAPHRLIIESLVGFYLYKLCQMEEEQFVCSSEMCELLEKPLDASEWEIIRNCEYLNKAKQFAILFLGEHADYFLKNLIGNDVLAYRSLITHLNLVTEEQMRNVLQSRLRRKQPELFDSVCKSLSKFVESVNSSVEDNTDLILLIRRVDSILTGEYSVYGTLPFQRFLKGKSSEEKGEMLSHILFVVPDQASFLKVIVNEITDDVVKQLQAECQKFNFRYDITNLNMGEETYISSYLLHMLSYSPKLNRIVVRGCYNINTNFCNTSIFEKCVSHGQVNLPLTHLDMNNTDLSKMNGSSFAHLFFAAPGLKILQISNCHLSGAAFNNMFKTLLLTDVELVLNDFYISGNYLKDIDGSLLACFLAYVPVSNLIMSVCQLSGDVMNDMVQACRTNEVELQLRNLDINSNYLRNVNINTMSTLLDIAPRLTKLDIHHCDMANYVQREVKRLCDSRQIKLSYDAVGLAKKFLWDTATESVMILWDTATTIVKISGILNILLVLFSILFFHYFLLLICLLIVMHIPFEYSWYGDESFLSTVMRIALMFNHGFKYPHYVEGLPNYKYLYNDINYIVKDDIDLRRYFTDFMVILVIFIVCLLINLYILFKNK